MRGLIPVGLGLALAAVAVACVVAPLAVYSLTLATLGIVHVLSELRYVDHRFGRRLGLTVLPLGALLLGVVALRIAGIAHLIDHGTGVLAEVGIVAVLALVVVPGLALRAGWPAVPAAAVAVALGTGVVVAPLHTFMALAILHNLTPLGFLAELLRGRARRLALGAGALLFVGIPALIATGLPATALAGLTFPDVSPIAPGGLTAHLGAYLHPSFHGATWAQHVFAGAVFAQCMHYAVVIEVLPRLLPATDRPLVPWPRGRALAIGLTLTSAALLLVFLRSFGDARAVYGVAAAVHAWVEIPLLLLALEPAGGRVLRARAA